MNNGYLAHTMYMYMYIGNGRQVNAQQCPLLNDIAPRLLSVNNILSILSLLEETTYCVGNDDVKFVQLLSNRHKDGFRDQTGNTFFQCLIICTCVQARKLLRTMNHPFWLLLLSDIVNVKL